MDLDIEMDDAGHDVPVAELPRDDILVGLRCYSPDSIFPY